MPLLSSSLTAGTTIAIVLNAVFALQNWIAAGTQAGRSIPQPSIEMP